MKFKLYSLSALAIAALMTACSNDDEIVQNPVTTAEGATPALSISLDELATRGFVSEKGAWTNFKQNNNGVQWAYAARVNLMVYNVNNPNNPIAIAEPQYITDADMDVLESDQITFQPLRVPAGNSYTAVAWVDFVNKDDHSKAFYDVANLNNVKMNFGETITENGGLDAEMRDAYTGKVSFTLTADGTTAQATADAVDMIPNPNGTDAPEAQEATAAPAADVTTLNILARRHFAKVRIVMTDYLTLGEWKQYFEGEDPGRVFNAEAMKIKDLASQFNALTQETINTVGGGDKIFMSEYAYYKNMGDVDPTINWVQPIVDGKAPTTQEELETFLSTKGMVGRSADITALGDDAIVFPVLSYNYLIPANQTDAAVYDIDFAALSHQAEGTYTWSEGVTAEPSTDAWKTLMVRHINSVPVVKNTLTTIWGNFLTVETPMFIVTINDVFDNEIDRVLLNDDSTTKTIITIGDVLVEIYRDANGDIVSVDVDKNEDAITAENYDELVQGLKDLKNWVETSKLNVYFNGYLKDNEPIVDAAIDEINLIAEGSLENPYTNTTFTNDVNIVSDVDQPKLTIETAKDLKVYGKGTYAELDLKGANVAVSGVKDAYMDDTDDVKVAGDVKIEATEYAIVSNADIDGNIDVKAGNVAMFTYDDVAGTTNVEAAGIMIAESKFADDATLKGESMITTSEFAKNLDITGKAFIEKSKVDGNLTVSDTAILTDDEVKGNTQLNGTGNVINGGKFDGTVTSEGTLTVNDDAFFGDTVYAKDTFVANGGTFDNSIHCYADATFNHPAYVNWSSDNRRYIYMEGNGSTITLNTNAGNVTCGDGVPTYANGGRITVKGSETGEGKTYYNIEAADQRFEIVE